MTQPSPLSRPVYDWAGGLLLLFVAGLAAWLYLTAPPDARLAQALAAYVLVFVLAVVGWLPAAGFRLRVVREPAGGDFRPWQNWCMWAVCLAGCGTTAGVVLAEQYVDLLA